MPVVIDGATHYTTTEAAALLGIQPGAVRDAIARGALAYRAIAPGQNMVPEPALEEYKRKRLGRRGRPKGAKNKPKASTSAENPSAGREGDEAAPDSTEQLWPAQGRVGASDELGGMMERTDRRAAAAHAHDRAMESPVVRLIIGKGREFGVEEWAHMVGILEGHVALQRRQDQRAVDAAMGIAAALAPPDEEMTRRAGASPAGQALLDEFGGFDAGAWPSVRAILGHYDALLRLDAAREVQPERAPLSEPLDVAAYRARKRDVLDPEAGEEE